MFHEYAYYRCLNCSKLYLFISRLILQKKLTHNRVICEIQTRLVVLLYIQVSLIFSLLYIHLCNQKWELKPLPNTSILQGLLNITRIFTLSCFPNFMVLQCSTFLPQEQIQTSLYIMCAQHSSRNLGELGGVCISLFTWLMSLG